MRRSAVALGSILVACGGTSETNHVARPSSTAPGPAQPAGAAVALPADPIVFCDFADRALVGAIACVPESKDQAEMGRRSIATAKETASKDEPFRSITAALCAGIADGIVHETEWRKCAIVLSATERAQVRAFLDAYYAQRSTPRPTGNPEVDRALQQFAAIRDKYCACETTDCADAAHREFDAASETIPRAASRSARDDIGALHDDTQRCRQRIEAAALRRR
jgi:hypothetical protein